MRYLTILIVALTLSGQAAAGCRDPELRSTWRVITGPIAMSDGTICTTSCQIRIGEGNKVMAPPSDCQVRIGETRSPFLPITGFLRYGRDRNPDKRSNSKRYAVVEGEWSFSAPAGEITWKFDGEQEHFWEGKSMKGATKCREENRAGTIHGRVMMYRNGEYVGQALSTMVWRSPAQKLKR